MVIVLLQGLHGGSSDLCKGRGWTGERLPHCQLMAQVSSELPTPAPWPLSWSPLTLYIPTLVTENTVPVCHSLAGDR